MSKEDESAIDRMIDEELRSGKKKLTYTGVGSDFDQTPDSKASDRSKTSPDKAGHDKASNKLQEQE